MRLIRTIILRLYIDLEQREQICGDLRVLPDRKTFSFKNKWDLLNLVVRLAKTEDKNHPLEALRDENDPDPPGSENSSG